MRDDREKLCGQVRPFENKIAGGFIPILGQQETVALSLDGTPGLSSPRQDLASLNHPAQILPKCSGTRHSTQPAWVMQGHGGAQHPTATRVVEICWGDARTRALLARGGGGTLGRSYPPPGSGHKELRAPIKPVQTRHRLRVPLLGCD